MKKIKGILSPISFQKYEENGTPTVLIYNAATDETTSIDPISPYYLHAVTALIVLEKCSENSSDFFEKKSNIVEITKPKLVVDNASS